MRYLILFALACVALAARTKFVEWKSGHYTYEAHLQTLVGLPESSQSFGGFAYRYKVHLNLEESRSDATMWIEVLKGGPLNAYELPERRSPWDLIPSEKVPSDMPDTEVRQWLSKKVKINIRDSFKLRHDPEEPFWSLNIKRGIAQMFMVQYKNDDISDATASFRRDTDVYTNMEECPIGNCMNTYLVTRKPWEKCTSDECNKYTWNITKTSESKTCIDRPLYNFTSKFFCNQCEDNLKFKREPLDQMVEVKYFFEPHREDSDKNVLTNCKVFARHVFSPFGLNKQDISAFERIEMRLLSAERPESIEMIKSPISSPVIMTIRPGWPFVSLSEVESTDMTNRVELFDTLVKNIVELRKSEDERMFEVLKNMQDILRVLGACTKPELKAIVKKYVLNTPISESHGIFEGKSEESIKRLIVLDLLAYVPNPFLPSIIIDAIESKKVSPLRAIQLLNTITISHRPEISYMEKLFKLFESFKTDSEYRTVAHTALLTHGSMVFRICNKDKPDWSELINEVCTDSLLNDYVNKYESLFAVCEHDVSDECKTEKVAILKAIGNSGMWPLVDNVLIKVLSYSKFDQVKVQAIYAMRRMARTSEHRVIVGRYLAPIILSESNTPEIRIAAYKILMSLNPIEPELMGVLHLFVENLNLEKASRQMQTFVYSHLSSMANSTHPCKERTISHVKSLLKMLRKPVESGIHYSHGYEYSFASDKWNLAGSVELNYVNTPKSYLPLTGNVAFSLNLFGSEVKLFETGWRAQGLRRLFEKFYGPHSSNERDSKRDSLFDRMRSPRSDRKVSEESTDEFNFQVYSKMFNDELVFAEMHKDNLESIITSLLEKFSTDKISLDYHKTIVLPKIFFKYPTAIGMPLCLNLTAITHFKTVGTVKTSEKDIKIKGNLISATYIAGKMFLQLPKYRTGIQVSAKLMKNLPINVVVKADMDKKKFVFSTDVEDKSEEKTLFLAEVRPETFVMRYNAESPLWKPDCKPMTEKKECYTKEMSSSSKHLVEKSDKKICITEKLCFPLAYYLTYTPMCNYDSRMKMPLGYKKVKLTYTPSTIKKMTFELNFGKPEEHEIRFDSSLLREEERREERESREERDSRDRRHRQSPVDEKPSKYEELKDDSEESTERRERRRSVDERRRVDDSISESDESDESSSETSPDNTWVPEYNDFFRSLSFSAKLRKLFRPVDAIFRNKRVEERSDKFNKKMYAVELKVSTESEPKVFYTNLLFVMTPKMSAVYTRLRTTEHKYFCQALLSRFSKMPVGHLSCYKDADNVPKITSIEEIKPTSELPSNCLFEFNTQMTYSDKPLNLEEIRNCRLELLNKKEPSTKCIEAQRSTKVPVWIQALFKYSTVFNKWEPYFGSCYEMIRFYLLPTYLPMYKTNVDNLLPNIKMPSKSDDKVKSILVDWRLQTAYKAHGDLFVRTEYRRDWYNRVPISALVKSLMPSRMTPFTTKITDYLFGFHMPAKCYMTPRKIVTFDGLVYESTDKMTSGKYVLAKDCSKYNDYVVYTEKEENLIKTVTIKINHPSIEKTVVCRSESSEKMTCKVENTRITSDKTYYDTDNESNYKLRVECTNDMCEVFVKPIGLRVTCLPTVCRVETSFFYWNRMCGLCGDFNTETYKECKTPEGKTALTCEKVIPLCRRESSERDESSKEEKDEKEIRESKDRRHPKDIRRPEERRESKDRRESKELRDSTESIESSEMCKPKEWTDIRFKHLHARNYICFSHEYVKMCKSSCVPLKTVVRPLKYTCLRKDCESSKKIREYLSENNMKIDRDTLSKFVEKNDAIETEESRVSFPLSDKFVEPRECTTPDY